MDTYRLIYPSGVVVEVQADSPEEAADLGFSFGTDLFQDVQKVEEKVAADT